ncbi:hypothetical protein Hanom_Chr05g00433191 [Helianthus anomalus]
MWFTKILDLVPSFSKVHGCGWSLWFALCNEFRPQLNVKKTNGVNESDENGKISNLLDPDAEKQTFGRKSQKWPNLRDENDILLKKTM